MHAVPTEATFSCRIALQAFDGVAVRPRSRLHLATILKAYPVNAIDFVDMLLHLFA
jgi:hypothetical protein